MRRTLTRLFGFMIFAVCALFTCGQVTIYKAPVACTVAQIKATTCPGTVTPINGALFIVTDGLTTSECGNAGDTGGGSNENFCRWSASASAYILAGGDGGAGLPPPICKTIEVPVDDEVFFTLFRAPAALTITEIYCEVTGGTSVAFDFEIDDGAPSGVNGSDIVCTTSGTTDSDFSGGDPTMADGELLDMDLGDVIGDVDIFSACAEYTWD